MAYTDIDKPDDYFNTKLYTGTGSATSITGVGFQPDLVWIKRRNDTGSHRLVDVVRGARNYIESDTTDAEGTTGNVSSFDSDGFSHSAGGLAYNASGSTYASWNWLAGGTGVSNTDGSITSTVSANTTSGFSIVSYTGTSNNNETVGHGLGVAPSVIIIKNRSVSANWSVLHTSAGLTGSTLDGSPEYYMLLLNDTGARGNVSEDNIWNPTSTTFKINNSGAGNQVNGNGNSMIAYCFAEKKGFSKFGSYTGNGSTDGTFVYTGFKPAFVMWKRTDTAGYDWDMYDTARDTYNVAFKELVANANYAESSSTVLSLDILSNGFKLRTSNANGNASGGTYIYMAFAESPFTTSTGIPTTAR